MSDFMLNWVKRVMVMSRQWKNNTNEQKDQKGENLQVGIQLLIGRNLTSGSTQVLIGRNSVLGGSSGSYLSKSDLQLQFRLLRQKLKHIQRQTEWHILENCKFLKSLKVTKEKMQIIKRSQILNSEPDIMSNLVYLWQKSFHNSERTALSSRRLQHYAYISIIDSTLAATGDKLNAGLHWQAFLYSISSESIITKAEIKFISIELWELDNSRFIRLQYPLSPSKTVLGCANFLSQIVGCAQVKILPETLPANRGL
eukprot:TRINITY_DN96557_c0_g1_i1.p1 TRINITY_DN96557_c0_g1~~TRINITY_DN96557_c0_g1_i1.p1  ORF type:complete len:276 (-),score=-32.07 TRINITY_DN96557_c0_g1_i1:31-795(-)